MGNNLSHVHAFRLTDGDEEKLRSLLQKCHIAIKPEKSSAMRYLIRAVYGVLREMDFEARMHARAAAQVPEDLSSAGPGISDEDEDGQLNQYVEEPWENPKEDPDYSRLRFQAIEELSMNGRSCDLMSVRAAVGELILREKLKKKEARIQAPARAESEQLIERFP